MLYTQSHLRDRQSRFFSYIGVVLHEMCHAYFFLYGHPSQRQSVELVGPKGHGRCWYDVASAVESTSNQVLGMPLNLYCQRDLDRELRGNRGWAGRGMVFNLGTRARVVGFCCYFQLISNLTFL